MYEIGGIGKPPRDQKQASDTSKVAKEPGGLGPPPPSAASEMTEVLRDLSPTSRAKSEDLRTVQSLLERERFVEHLVCTNTFIFHRAGHSDLLLSVLKKEVGKQKMSVREIRTLANLKESFTEPTDRSMEKRRGASRQVLVLLPTTATSRDSRQMVAEALASGSQQPIWLIAFPTFLNKQLLALFHNFFLFKCSERELSIFQDVLGLQPEEILKKMAEIEDLHSLTLITTYSDKDIKPGEPVMLTLKPPVRELAEEITE